VLAIHPDLNVIPWIFYSSFANNHIVLERSEHSRRVELEGADVQCRLSFNIPKSSMPDPALRSSVVKIYKGLFPVALHKIVLMENRTLIFGKRLSARLSVFQRTSAPSILVPKRSQR
jgi:hypothetical protein